MTRSELKELISRCSLSADEMIDVVREVPNLLGELKQQKELTNEWKDKYCNLRDRVTILRGDSE